MGDRNVYGNDFSENGWRMVDANSCQWVTVPGTSVHLQIREGQPGKIMGAFAADFNAFVEPLRDADSACWTATNSVGSSNHLSGTAMDLDWNSHPFRQVNAGFNDAQVATIRDMLGFYEKTMWWGNDWDSPKDAMHFQMGYDTYGSENVDRVQGFINRKIRADGFSTYRRGGTITPPAPAPVSNAADVLTRATGVSLDKANQILVGVVNGLRDSQCTNVNRVAMWLAQMGHESAGFNATEEYASGAAYEGRSDLGNTQPGDGVRFKGRSWIQITGRSNYAALSRWANGKGIVPTPTFFVDNPQQLALIQYAGLGPAWYWTVARADINALSDNRDLVTVTRRINGGTNGLSDRQARYDRALTLGDQLLTLTNAAPAQGDDMASVPQDQWDRVYRELTQQLHSRSPLRHLDDAFTDTMAGYGLNADAHGHFTRVKELAALGHPESLALLREVASAKGNPRYPDRQDDALVAQAILSELSTTPTARVANVAEVAADPAVEPQIVYVDRPVAAPSPPVEPVVYTDTSNSTGQVIGRAYDALQALKLADALPIEDRAPLAALIGVLQTKNGTQL